MMKPKKKQVVCKWCGRSISITKDIEKAYQQGKDDEDNLQEFAQWLWDNHYLTNEAFTVRLVDGYKESKELLKRSRQNE